MSDIQHIGEQSPFDAIRRVTPEGREYWTARELMPLLGYDQWRNFERCVDEAQKAAAIAGAQDQFADTSKMVETGSGARRSVSDVEMTRYGAYMVAMACDGRKPEVAAAKTYFAVQTRVAETRPVLTGPELLARAVLEAQHMIAAKDGRIAELEEQREIDRPAIEYVNTHVVVTDDVMLIEDWGRTYGLTKPNAFALLRDKKDLIYAKNFERWSRTQGCKVVETEYRPRAGKQSFTWFDVKEQRDAPRRNNGQARKTLYIKAVHAVDLARLVGLLPNIEVAS